ncbi:MAG: hypothetical protein ACYC5M_08075 [Anaerolineae bacterium]
MWLEVVRDVAIVLLALMSVIIGVLAAITLLQIRSLVRVLQDEIVPMLDTVNGTLRTVNGTTQFVSDNVVDPVVKVSSFTTGTLQTMRSLLSIKRKVRGS